MLKFIFGLPCSGKSYNCIQKIKALSINGEQTVLLVPEQFSFESEKQILNALGDSFSLNTSVLSFSKLSDEVSRTVGGICARVLSDADRVIFMNKALTQVATELKLWGKYAHSVTFAKSMLDTVSELKLNSITPQDLKKASENTQRASLKAKLLDLSLVYETFDYLISERFIDPSDELSHLYEKLGRYKYFENKTVFIDSFKGFTGSQYKILERIFSQAKDVYVYFTNDNNNLSEYNIFSNIRTAIQKISGIANKYGIIIEEAEFLGNSYYNSEDLHQLERLISGNTIKCGNKSENVTVCCGNTPYDEAEFTARTIRKLVREQNYRFRDFVIVTRDTEKYSDAVENACKKNNVSLFLDKRLPLSALPFCVLVDNAIRATNFNSENIFGFLKSGIDILKNEEISILENYTYLWNVNGDIWLNDWDMNPNGFVTEDIKAEDIENLRLINQLRIKAIEPIIEFKNNFYGDALKMSKAIITLFDKCNLKCVLTNMCATFDAKADSFSSEVLKQGYGAFLNILDSLVICFGKKSLTKNEYYESLSLAVSLETIGVIPQTLDQVTFGEASRIRPSRPKVAFVLGANQGVFPKFANASGVFTIFDRKQLIDLDLNISDNSITTAIDENYLVYCNVCCPTDKLYITYANNGLQGENMEPSAFVNSIKENLNPIITIEPKALMINDNLPETEQSAFSEFCRRIGNKNEAEVFNFALENSENKQKLETLISNFNNKTKSITPENAKKLYGNDIYMSATKLDTLNRCKFSFFCKYGLKTKKLQPADFDVLQRGTIVHYVLERFITENKEKFKILDAKELDNLTERYINEYLELVSGYNTIKNARHEFVISKIARSLKEVVAHLTEEFKQSDFSPVSCELKIGKGGIPLNYNYENGKILFSGSIDRVDEYGGFVRVVDYKTGSKKFKLPDILFGLNLQMLLYLYAVVKNKDVEPAGILYMPSKRDLKDEGMAMNGLLIQDIELIKAMDKNIQGEYIPKPHLNSDNCFSKSDSSYITKEQFEIIFKYIEKLMYKAGNIVAGGDIAINPIDGCESPACSYCDYKAVCGIENKEIFKVPSLKNSEVFEKMGEAN